MKVEWREGKPGDNKPAYYAVMVYEDGRETDVIWAPQKGSQEAFLSCPISECLYEGTRGPGKTDALIMDFSQHCGPKSNPSDLKGYGSEWRGVLFRRTYPELQDVIDKSKRWLPKIFPGIRYNEAKNFWEWVTGEKLFFRQFDKQSDYWSYHGHAYPWIAWEELTTWPDDKCYKSMFSCARSTVPGIPIKIRATTNPYGVGHNWVKRRFRLPLPKGRIIGSIINDAKDIDGNSEPPRVAIRGHLSENLILLKADPTYVQRIRTAARNKSELLAWLDGSWDIIAGGMFDDVWDTETHVVPDLPFDRIPNGWTIDRSYDHGSSRPFSVGWWAESNGEPIEYNGRKYGTVRGDLYRIAEYYGCRANSPNEGLRLSGTEIAKEIVKREKQWGIWGRVKSGPADTNIFDEYEKQKTIAGDMAKLGVYWLKADKGPNSRVQGWDQIRKLLKASKPKKGALREEPGLFIMERCEDCRMLFPVLPRDDKVLDDVDTNSEDHIGDDMRYRIRVKRRVMYRGNF